MKDHSRFVCQLFGSHPPYARGRHGDGCRRGRGGPIGNHHGHMHHGHMKHGHDHKELHHGHHHNKQHHGHHHKKHHHGHHHTKHDHGHHFLGLMKGSRHFGHHKHSGRFQFGPEGRPRMEIGNCSVPPEMTKKLKKILMKHWIEKSQVGGCLKNKCQVISKNKDQDLQNKEVGSETGCRSAPRRYSV